MNPLFVRLAQRATRTAEVLERRPRALFEPKGAAGMATLQAIDAEKEVTADSPPGAKAGQPVGRMDPQAEDRAPVPPARETPSQRTRPVERQTPPTPAQRIAIAQPLDNAAPAVHSTEPAPYRPNVAQAPSPHPSEPPPSATRPQAVAPAVERLTLTERRVEIARTLRETTPAAPMAPPRQALRPTPAPPPRAEAVLQPPPRSAPVAPLARALAQAEAPLAPAAMAAPVVQFSIGRLEVRAPSPAAEKRAIAREKGPRLSLEAYLEGRRGER